LRSNFSIRSVQPAHPFFPKKLRFDSITPHQVAFAMHRLNHRPRKCLGFKTPHEVFMTQLKSCHNVVALQG
jgi:IS30 family transposase